MLSLMIMNQRGDALCCKLYDTILFACYSSKKVHYLGSSFIVISAQLISYLTLNSMSSLGFWFWNETEWQLTQISGKLDGKRNDVKCPFHLILE